SRRFRPERGSLPSRSAYPALRRRAPLTHRRRSQTILGTCCNRWTALVALVTRILGFLALLLLAKEGFAQGTDDYPTRPVKLVVRVAAAGPPDFIARLTAQKAGEQRGKPFYVENHPGAGGNIGMGLVAQSPPDGHTILVISSSLVINPSLYAKTPY